MKNTGYAIRTDTIIVILIKLLAAMKTSNPLEVIQRSHTYIAHCSRSCPAAYIAF
jgi:hypothetical protein